jgi:5-formyltetrahydrofolate cyclo-ligase
VTESVTDAAASAAKKDEWRARLRMARRSLAPAVVLQRSEAAIARLLALPSLSSVRTLALFAGMDSERELDPRGADAAFRARGVRTVYPRVAARKPPTLSFHLLEDLDGLVPGPLGVEQPAVTSAQVPLDEIDAFVLPGLGFTASGGRIGFGAGFYDATLLAAPRARRVGLCHPEQLVDELPMSTRDQRIDEIVLPDRVITCLPARVRAGDRS